MDVVQVVPWLPPVREIRGRIAHPFASGDLRMQHFLAVRLLLAIPTLIGATLLVFIIMRVVPGDIAYAFLAGEEGAASIDPASLEKLREELGLLDPLPIQYLKWLGGVVRGDLGRSMWNKAPISEEILARFPITAQLAFMAIIIGFAAGLTLGVISALNHDTWIDNIARIIAINQLAIPAFWQGLMIILFTVRVFQWMPPLGYHPIWVDPARSLTQLIFPAAVVGSNLMALVARMTRSTMLEVMREDYVRTARAKGLMNRTVIVRHVMRNAMIPVVTIVSLSFGGLLNGTVVMETVFSVPGLGLYLIQSIIVRDYTVTQALVFFFAGIFIAINLLVDIMYGWLDPRISRH